MSLLDRLHGRGVHARRVRVLCREISRLLPERGIVADVGCGDGLLTGLLARARPDLRFVGLDVLMRDGSGLSACRFDGQRLPLADACVDAVLFIDVLHHAADAKALLAEARRVTRGTVILKDHLLDPWLAGPRLRFMDYVGNARHGVALPYHYLRRPQWEALFAATGLVPQLFTSDFALYPWPASWLFGGRLHFLARLATR